MELTKPDFSRNVHCLLGLPFDAITLQQSLNQIAKAALIGQSCYFATPNLNFLVSTQKDQAFRSAVLNCDLSLADGMPIVWIAKLLGAPIPERVAGSDVFDSLRKSAGNSIKVYLFGGPSGVAQQAADKINAHDGRLRCVGFESPGFGSLEDMSQPETLARINASGAQFLVVSLGAAKGHAWIEKNRANLTVPVVSHLGAVVNFVAGSVNRAPLWMQKWGLEWMWRILQEPSLWRRYWRDAIGLFKLVILRILPILFLRSVMSCNKDKELVIVQTEVKPGEVLLTLSGAACSREVPKLRRVMNSLPNRMNHLTIDMQGLCFLGTEVAGILLLADSLRSRSSIQVNVIRANWILRSYLSLQGLKWTFSD